MKTMDGAVNRKRGDHDKYPAVMGDVLYIDLYE